MKKELITMRNGETVELRWTDGGGPVCPVCGAVFDPDVEHAWDSGGGPSFNVCFSCYTEFGRDDGMSSQTPIGAFAKMWEDLRIKWLNRVGWNDTTLRQLRENLDVDMDTLKRKTRK